MVKRLFLIAFLAAGLAGCDDDGPTEPSDPNVVVFTAQLAASNEVPPITNAEANARGDVRITFNLTRDAGNNITGGTVTFVVNLNSFPAGSTWTLAHIHEGAAGIAGSVRINTGLTPGNAITLANGSISNHRFENIDVPATGSGTFTSAAALINAIIENPNGFYFNVHTALNGGGAVRGQLFRQ